MFSGWSSLPLLCLNVNLLRCITLARHPAGFTGRYICFKVVRIFFSSSFSSSSSSPSERGERAWLLLCCYYHLLILLIVSRCRRGSSSGIFTRAGGRKLEGNACGSYGPAKCSRSRVTGVLIVSNGEKKIYQNWKNINIFIFCRKKIQHREFRLREKIFKNWYFKKIIFLKKYVALGDHKFFLNQDIQGYKVIIERSWIYL